MKKAFLFGALLLSMTACPIIEEIQQPCSLVLKDGMVIYPFQDVRINSETKTITYRDEEGKLWSYFQEDYVSFDCTNRNQD